MRDNSTHSTPCEITIFTKSDGPLTKRITLAADGTIISDASGCVMSRGKAQRTKVADVEQLTVADLPRRRRSIVRFLRASRSDLLCAQRNCAHHTTNFVHALCQHCRRTRLPVVPTSHPDMEFCQSV